MLSTPEIRFTGAKYWKECKLSVLSSLLCFQTGLPAYRETSCWFSGYFEFHLKWDVPSELLPDGCVKLVKTPRLPCLLSQLHIFWCSWRWVARGRWLGRWFWCSSPLPQGFSVLSPAQPNAFFLALPTGLFLKHCSLVTDDWLRGSVKTWEGGSKPYIRCSFSSVEAGARGK